MGPPPPGSSLDRWLAYQQQVHPRAMDLSLDRVRAVAARMDLLTPGCPLALVGGTNGKGSTATLLAALIQAGGHRVGLYTSPHLVRYNERIRIDGVPVEDARLVAAFERIEAARAAITLTYFEYGTLAALDVFRDAGIGALVLEVGLGGRLDATNILEPDVSVLCSVGLDHRDVLGDTLDGIGAEKAGIFRAHRPVVLGSAEMPASVGATLRSLGCPALVAEQDFIWQVRAAGSWDYRLVGRGGHGTVSLESLPAPRLAGPIQYRNAATAITALYQLPLQPGPGRQSIEAALRRAELPGRFQIVPGPIEWILDVAHNEPAAQVLAAALAARAPRRTVAVAGILADKDAAAIVRALDPLVDRWILAGLQDNPRGQTASDLARRIGPVRGPVELTPDPTAACALARSLARPDERVLVLGSFHIVGPALHWLGLY